MTTAPHITVLENLHLPERFLEKIKKDIEYIIKSNLNSLEFIVLFGSCANGKLKVTSDIDLLIITNDRLDQVVRGDIATELAEPVKSVATDAIFDTVDELKTGKSLFLKQVMKEGIVIWKKD
ncbi:MAG TPA: nucleotidyltransferase domain-containing protein [Clostridiales bacterium]|nr:nucleotidyltransferase domain-containing protein [Clostridiales bacterium]